MADLTYIAKPVAQNYMGIGLFVVVLEFLSNKGCLSMKKINEMSWIEFDKKRKETNIVIIPTGAIEVYGPHLPLGTDTIVAEEIARRVAEKVDVLVGPTIEVGDSAALNVFPGTLTIQPENFKGYLYDICMSLINWGFKNFLFINTHLGNVPIINQICERLQKEQGVVCSQIDWWRFVQPHCEGITQYSGIMAHGHAAETGTSVMLYLRKDLVDTTKLEAVTPKQEDKFPEIIKYPALNEITDSGVIGDPTVASEEKGKKIVEKSINRIIEYINSKFK